MLTNTDRTFTRPTMLNGCHVVTVSWVACMHVHGPKSPIRPTPTPFITRAMRVLLLTNNVGGVFDSLDEHLQPWLDELDDTVSNSAADFVALHIQELAGSRAVEDGTATLDSMQRFSNAITARFPDFWSSGLMCSSALDADFTGLGCLVLVRRSLTKDVAIYSFDRGQTGEGAWMPVSTLADPLVAEPALPARWARHSPFSRDLFDRLDPKWARKGWLHHRWRVDKQPFDLLNVHLFDDINHIRALNSRRDISAPISVYAASRRDALRQALQMLTAAGPAPAALGPVPPALSVFGDLNWRLDVRSVLSHLAGESGLADALSAVAAAEDSTSARVVVPYRIEAVPGDDQAPSGWGGWVRRCRCLVFAPLQRVVIEAHRFAMEEEGGGAAVFSRHPSAFRGCDLELAVSRTLIPPLDELPINFPPTHRYRYRFHHRNSSTAACPPDENRCCPSWCDRVLLDAAGMRLMPSARDVSYAATPTEDDAPRTPRPMVHLAFTLAPSSTLGMEPIPVHVRADVTAPVPIKVKCVAVGAG